MNITPITDLVTYSQGTVVELPAFAEGQPFVAKLRRPSMLSLMEQGKIPNSLLSAANSLFSGGGEPDDSSGFYKDILGVIEILAEASFVEPSWEDMKSAGVELTDEQYTFIFNYSQRGVKALENFRTNEEDSIDNTTLAIV